MSINTLLSKEIIIKRRTFDSFDEYGNPISDEIEVEVVRGKFEIVRADEDIRDKNEQKIEAKVYLFPRTEIEGYDFVEIDGVDYELVGHPVVVFHPFKNKPQYKLCYLRRIE